MARILLADDDEKLRETLAEALRAEGWDVLTANNGANAQQVWDDATAGGDTPKVVVLDALMPKVSGFDAAKAIKAKDPETAFIFITGVFKSAAQQQDAKDKFDCKAYLVKPFDLAKLVEAVRPLMAVHEAAATFQPAEPLPGEGTLLEAPVAYLLWRAEKEKHTGALDLFGANERARVFIYKGKAVFGQHSDPMINIGIELIKDGVLTAESYRQAVEMCVQRSAGLYDVIKTEGWATDAQMRPVYKRVVPKVIEKVAAMNGRFRWTATDEFSSIVPAATVAIVDTLLGGIRKARRSPSSTRCWAASARRARPTSSPTSIPAARCASRRAARGTRSSRCCRRAAGPTASRARSTAGRRSRR
jgi:two-component system, cell cycle response regulator CpdR